MFLSGLVHDIGSALGLTSGNPKKKQPVQATQKTTPLPAPGTLIKPTQTSASPVDNSINLVKLHQAGAPPTTPGPVTQYNPAAPLVKAAPPTNKTPAVVPKPVVAPPAAKPTGFIHALSTLGAGAAGTALAATRAAEGAASGIVETPSLIVNGVNDLANKMTGNTGHTGFTNAVNRVTGDIDTPINALAKKTDQATAGFGQGAEDVYKPAQVVDNVLAVAPGVASVVGKGAEIANLSKIKDVTDAVQATAEAQKAASPTVQLVSKVAAPVKAALARSIGPTADAASAPDEVASGLKSVNPNQAQDALEQVGSSTPEPGSETATPLTPPAEVDNTSAIPPTPAQPAPESEPVSPDAMHSTETETLNNLDKDAKNRILTPVEKTTRTALQTKKDTILAANEPAPETPGIPAQSPKAVNPGKPLVPTAPNTRAAIIKHIGAAAKNLGDGDLSETTNLDELKSGATATVANLSDKQVVDTLGSSQIDDLPHNANGVAIIRAGIDRLAKMDPDDPDVVAALNNSLNSIAKTVKEGSTVMRFIQQDFDSLPLPMKVRYIVNKIDTANKNVKGYEALKDDPAKISAVEDAITSYLTSGEQISDRIATLQGKLQEVEDATSKVKKIPVDAQAMGVKGATAGETINASPKQIANQVYKTQQELAANNGNLTRYYDTKIPSSSAGQKINDFARSMMLSSVTGRLNSAIFAGNNVAHLSLENLTRGVLAKAVNKFSPGKALDTSKGFSRLFTGAKRGASQLRGELKGQQYTGDLQKSLSSNTAELTGMRKSTNPVLTKIQALTEAPSNLTKGVEDQNLYQQAYQEGQQKGVPKDLLNQYATARAANPSPLMRQNASELKQAVNHLNKNPISDALNRVSKAIGQTEINPGDSAGVKIGKFTAGAMKNQVLPFTSFLGGNMWNSFTDKNVVANLVKLIGSAHKGDVDGIVKNLAKTANNTAYTYALGYLLTKNGIITNKGPDGYNDAGAYLHVGDRYIPANFLGFFAPSLILGNALYQGLNSDGGKGNVASKFGHTVASSLTNGLISTGAQSLGSDNNALKSVTTATGSGSTEGNAGNAGAQLGGGAVGEFVPAGASDVNAVLNNGLGPVKAYNNPNHEAPLTKATSLNPKTGNQVKNYPKTAVNTLLNKIPGVSQHLPRNPGVAAPDLLDRTTRGTRSTTTEDKTAATAKVTADTSASDLKSGVPDPDGKYAKGDSFNDAVENRIENKKYDQATAGLQQQLDKLQNAPDATTTKTAPIQKQIKQIAVLKAGNFDPSIRDLYSKTSVTDWRDMGNPTNANYDPTTYNKLYAYDTALAKAGISSNSLKATDNKYALPAASTKSAANAALDKIKSNTVSSPAALSSFDFSNLTPQKITGITMPTIQALKSSNLKKRAISVSAKAS